MCVMTNGQVCDVIIVLLCKVFVAVVGDIVRSEVATKGVAALVAVAALFSFSM